MPMPYWQPSASTTSSLGECNEGVGQEGGCKYAHVSLRAVALYFGSAAWQSEVSLAMFPVANPLLLSPLRPTFNRRFAVISLIPYTFHPLVIEAAIKAKKHFVSTSYVSAVMAGYDQA